MWSITLLIIGFAFLIKGADFLVDGASSVAKSLKVSDLVIGLTVVAFGTSCPELFVNIVASIKGNTEIAIGNILGSNIANIFLILGIASLIYPLAVTKGMLFKEIPLSLLAALLLGILANDQLIDKSRFSALTRIDGFIFLCFFIIFIYYSFSLTKRAEGRETHFPSQEQRLMKSVFFVIVGLAGLILGGKLAVEGAVGLALRFKVSQSLIGLTIVAIGTSLPELATSCVAAFKKNAAIAIGNVVGSNIFNIFFILGLSSLIRPIPFFPQANLSIVVVILANLLLLVSMFTGKKRLIDRWEGVVFIVLYIVYLAYLVIQG